MAASYNELFGLGTHSEDAALEGWWKLQETTGTIAVDSSTSGNDGTINGMGSNPTTSTGPKGVGSYLASSFDFDGSNDFVDLNTNLNIGSPNTFVLWCNFDDLDSIQHVIGVENGTTNGFFYRLRGDAAGDPMQITYRGVGVVDGTTSPTATTWQQLAVTVTSGYTATHYIDGVSSGSGDLTGEFNPGTIDMYLGARNDDGVAELLLDAKLADFAVFSRDLTVAELGEHQDGPEPLNTVAPAVTGTEEVGETLTSTGGTWDSQGNGTVVSSYQWTRSTSAAGAGEADISGATSSTYVLVASDSGKYIRCRVRGTNTGGFDSAEDTNSNMTGAITGAGPTATPKGVFGLPLHGPFAGVI